MVIKIKDYKWYIDERIVLDKDIGLELDNDNLAIRKASTAVIEE